MPFPKLRFPLTQILAYVWVSGGDFALVETLEQLVLLLQFFPGTKIWEIGVDIKTFLCSPHFPAGLTCTETQQYNQTAEMLY